MTVLSARALRSIFYPIMPALGGWRPTLRSLSGPSCVPRRRRARRMRPLLTGSIRRCTTREAQHMRRRDSDGTIRPPLSLSNRPAGKEGVSASWLSSWRRGLGRPHALARITPAWRRIAFDNWLGYPCCCFRRFSSNIRTSTGLAARTLTVSRSRGSWWTYSVWKLSLP